MLSLKKFFNFGIASKKSVKKNFRKVMHQLSLEERFSKIYEIDYWGNATKSGAGSTLASTENLRKQLPKLFEQFKIKTVFDGPCGDFNWMQLVIKETAIDYIGGDIVSAIVEENQKRYSSDKAKFIKVDLTKDSLPIADLMICRDCLFHLSYEDSKLVLENYLKSNIPYLLTTSYKNDNTFKNKDILTGHFRVIDLFSSPYQFPKDTLYEIEDWLEPESPRSMYLWSRTQIIEAVKFFNLHE
jgi:hypothetical protein